MKTNTIYGFGLAALALIVFTFGYSHNRSVQAAGDTIYVIQNSTQGFSTADSTTGGSVTYNTDTTSPGGFGSLTLSTANTTTAKAQYLAPTNTLLSNVSDLSYQTKMNTGGDASYQLVTCLGGVTGTTCNGFTTLVYEPYQNGTVTPGTWQMWNVAGGNFWSTRSYNTAGCTVNGTAGGPATYSLSFLQAACPNAVVVGFGVNVGSNNPGYNTQVDLLNFNGTTYNFQPYLVPLTKDDCKNGGYANFTRANGTTFSNQGQCVSYVARMQHDSDNGDDDDEDGNNATPTPTPTPSGSQTPTPTPTPVASPTPTGTPSPTPQHFGPPTTIAQCKNGGWMHFDTPRHFNNQGDCIRWVQQNGRGDDDDDDDDGDIQ